MLLHSHLVPSFPAYSGSMGFRGTLSSWKLPSLGCMVGVEWTGISLPAFNPCWTDCTACFCSLSCFSGLCILILVLNCTLFVTRVVELI